jgi:RNA polymerase sigma factor (TIGR02999 family)
MLFSHHELLHASKGIAEATNSGGSPHLLKKLERTADQGKMHAILPTKYVWAAPMANLEPELDGSGNSITALLVQLSEGNHAVEDRLIPQVYAELRRVAAHHMRFERGNHTLQPTALVHEAYERLVQPHSEIAWQSRAHFFATASRLMRNILVDHARAKHAGKRGGLQHQVSLDEAFLPSNDRLIDVLVLDDALDHLATFDARQARIVELHFFVGLNFEEIAVVLGVSVRTVKSDWGMSRDWLRGELTKRP